MTSVNTYVILCVAVAFAHSARAKMGGWVAVCVGAASGRAEDLCAGALADAASKPPCCR